MKIHFGSLRNLLLLSSALVILICIAVALPLRQKEISQSTFERVQLGMTEEEVTATLGGPPGKRFMKNDCLWKGKDVWGDLRPYVPYKVWWGRDFGVKVCFDQ